MNNDSLISSLIPAVEQQLKSEETQYVKATFTRLVEQEKFSPNDAMEAIALCLADESNRMLIDKRNFDVLRYQELLLELPHRAEEKS